MTKANYEDAAYRLQRLIKAIFGDKLARTFIADYDDATKTECIIEMFSNVLVVVPGTITKDRLAEMAWYGCNLELISATRMDIPQGAAIRLYFDCRQFANDLNVERV